MTTCSPRSCPETAAGTEIQVTSYEEAAVLIHVASSEYAAQARKLRALFDWCERRFGRVPEPPS